jgi:hypothetical protein
MSKVQFFGRIFPSVCKVTLSLDPGTAINWIDEERQTSYTFRIYITDGNVRVDCEAPHYQTSHFDELYRRAFDLARASVDVLAFGLGWGPSVVFEKFQDSAGAVSDLLLHDPRLVPLVTAFKLNAPPPNNLEETLKIVWADPRVFFALRDLIEAITLPHRTTVCCARAIEGLRTLVAGPTTSRGEAWRVFREKLQLDERFLKLITDNSVDARHGQHARLSGAITTEIAQRSWIIMNRFLEYRLRGSEPLVSSTFPLLRG